MEKFIPEDINPLRYAEQQLSIDGVVAISDMHRLHDVLGRGSRNDDGKAVVHLQFGVDEQGTVFLTGHLTAKLLLQCQRCMEPFDYEIISDFVLAIVSTFDEAQALSEHYEPALTKEGSLALRELIEDELILNLPIIPKHAPEHCKVKLPLVDASWQEQKRNPFQVLAPLKGKQSK